MKIDVVLRTMDELQAVIDADPFGEAVDNPTRYFVVFLDREPRAGQPRGRGFRPRSVQGQRQGDLRVVPRGHAELAPNESSQQAGPRRRHRHGAQLGDCATSLWTDPPNWSSNRRAPGSCSVACTSWSMPSTPELRTRRAWIDGCRPAGLGALRAGGPKLRRAASTSSCSAPAWARASTRCSPSMLREPCRAASSRARTSAARASSDSVGGRASSSGRGSAGGRLGARCRAAARSACRSALPAARGRRDGARERPTRRAAP